MSHLRNCPLMSRFITGKEKAKETAYTGPSEEISMTHYW